MNTCIHSYVRMYFTCIHTHIHTASNGTRERSVRTYTTYIRTYMHTHALYIHSFIHAHTYSKRCHTQACCQATGRGTCMILETRMCIFCPEELSKPTCKPRYQLGSRTGLLVGRSATFMCLVKMRFRRSFTICRMVTCVCGKSMHMHRKNKKRDVCLHKFGSRCMRGSKHDG
jgi:hypothetical protein